MSLHSCFPRSTLSLLTPYPSETGATTEGRSATRSCRFPTEGWRRKTRVTGGWYDRRAMSRLRHERSGYEVSRDTTEACNRRGKWTTRRAASPSVTTGVSVVSPPLVFHSRFGCGTTRVTRRDTGEARTVRDTSGVTVGGAYLTGSSVVSLMSYAPRSEGESDRPSASRYACPTHPAGRIDKRMRDTDE